MTVWFLAPGEYREMDTMDLFMSLVLQAVDDKDGQVLDVCLLVWMMKLDTFQLNCQNLQ